MSRIGARYMTATLMCNSDTATPKTTPVTFILSGHRLVTVRYDEPRPFTLVGNKLAPHLPGQRDRRNRADGSARCGDRSRRRHSRAHRRRGRPGLARHLRARRTAADAAAVYKDILKAIGRKGDLTSKVRESLVSIGRLLLFLANEAEGMRWPKDMRAQLQTMQRDVLSLSDHATYLTNKITFLLDAMLGVVSIEQNNIIKIFSVVAVVLMPPTLVASVYGMNFKHMPELDWDLRLSVRAVLMLVVGDPAVSVFKWKKWL